MVKSDLSGSLWRGIRCCLGFGVSFGQMPQLSSQAEMRSLPYTKGVDDEIVWSDSILSGRTEAGVYALHRFPRCSGCLLRLSKEC